MNLPWGMFGENLTTEGWWEDEIHIGDRFRAGTAEFVVTQPRMPCFKLALKFDRDDVIERFLDRSRKKPHVDLIAFTIDILRSRGITAISDSGLCTRCAGSIFHSYRRDGAGKGRNLVLVSQ